MSDLDINKGDMVRVIVAGKFHGQVVKVLSIDGRRMRGLHTARAYKLAVMWDGMLHASFFTRDEIEPVEPESEVEHV